MTEQEQEALLIQYYATKSEIGQLNTRIEGLDRQVATLLKHNEALGAAARRKENEVNALRTDHNESANVITGLLAQRDRLLEENADLKWRIEENSK